MSKRDGGQCGKDKQENEGGGQARRTEFTNCKRKMERQLKHGIPNCRDKKKKIPQTKTLTRKRPVNLGKAEESLNLNQNNEQKSRAIKGSSDQVK